MEASITLIATVCVYDLYMWPSSAHGKLCYVLVVVESEWNCARLILTTLYTLVFTVAG